MEEHEENHQRVITIQNICPVHQVLLNTIQLSSLQSLHSILNKPKYTSEVYL